jgi:hypothetical protein
MPLHGLPALLPDGYARGLPDLLQALLRDLLERMPLLRLQAGSGNLLERMLLYGLPAGVRAALRKALPPGRQALLRAALPRMLLYRLQTGDRVLLSRSVLHDLQAGHRMRDQAGLLHRLAYLHGNLLQAVRPYDLRAGDDLQDGGTQMR